MNNIMLLATGTLVLLSAALPTSDAFSAPHSTGRRRRPRSSMRVASNNAGMIKPFSNHSVASAALPYYQLQDTKSTLRSRKRVGLDEHADDERCVEAVLFESFPSDNEPPRPPSFVEGVLSTYVGPRLVLALVAVLYGTNFPLGAIMNDNLPASAATSSRMVLASLVLSPFLMKLRPSLRRQVLLGGAFVSLGYISQSVALIDTSPALVSFLGSATVLVCPVLQWLVDRRPMGIKDAPQTWLAAALCLSGVASLELFDSSTNTFSLDLLSRLGTGDALSLVQAVGFGTGVFLSEKMMTKEPDQALPITAGLVSATAFFAMLWCLADGWMTNPGWESMGLPGLFMNANMRTVALAVLWTGVVSTSLNFYIEITALGRVPSSEASVILATEPLWASLFAAVLFHEQFGTSDYVGGLLMISACLVNTLRPSDIMGFFAKVSETAE
ncbi:hypothetical protein ACHAW5_000518 [Stephanodiscus triporus]|uniref:EamA domain-containing protein n=1 Tax=Stephanodiscus triporus TaxID=2934178 RepID=A0ABD3PK57_9STRA